MSRARRVLFAFALLLSACGGAAWAAPVFAASAPGVAPETVVLVATRELRDPLYGGTVLIARPLQGGRYVGFILNRPTRIQLGELFPAHEPSRRVRDPVFLGGPEDINVVTALVADHDSPGDGSMQLAPDLYLALTARTVDHVIESLSDHARFFAGAVLWQAGELDQELKQRAWYVLDLEPEVVMRKKTDDLWQELVQRAEIQDKGI
jgi:putative transcriptional regulator